MQENSPITFGKVLTETVAESFIITESIHAPNSKLALHDHESSNLVWILSGSCVESTASKTHECFPQSVIIKPAGAHHRNEYFSAGAHCLSFEIRNQGNDEREIFGELFSDISVIRVSGELLLIKQIFKEISAPNDLSKITIEGLFQELLGKLLEQITGETVTGTPIWLSTAKDYIHENFMETLSLSKVARVADAHPSHVARVFRQNFNSSIGDYIRRLRLCHAIGELVSTDKPLAEIAGESGFFDQSHFTNLFRDFYGVTPKTYRDLRTHDSR